MPVDYMHSTIGLTSLGIAAQKGFDDVRMKLLTLGANSSFVDLNGKSALNYAKENRRDVNNPNSSRFYRFIKVKMSKNVNTAESYGMHFDSELNLGNEVLNEFLMFYC